MKILFDHCVPRPFRRLLTSYTIQTTQECGWAALSNGALLDAAEAAGFDVFLTVDRNLPYQQNFTGRTIRVLVLEVPNNRVATLAPLVPLILAALATMVSGEVRRIRQT